MPSIMFGQLEDAEVPADQNVVRRNTAPVDLAEAPAEAPNAPEFNEFDADSNPRIGLVTRGVAGDYTPTEKFSPSWADEVDNADQFNRIVDVQVSNSGTAASREKAGQYGHGSMAVSRSIEPIVRDGGAMGNDYFAAYDPDIQATMTRETGLQPDAQGYGPGRENVASVSAYGKSAARDANAASYQDFFRAVTGK